MTGTQHDIAFFQAFGKAVCFLPPFSHQKNVKKKEEMLAFFNRISRGDTVPASLSPNMFKEQDGMLAFFLVLPPIFLHKMFKKQNGMLASFLLAFF